MGEAIARGLFNSPHAEHYSITGTTRNPEKAKAISEQLSISCHTDSLQAVKNADILIIATKPHQVEDVLKSVQSGMRSDQILISICTAISTQTLSHWSGNTPAIIRAMPNTPCLIHSGVTALCAGPRATPEQLNQAEAIFKELGEVTILEESLFHGVTGLSGCGPAYGYMMIEALSEAGVKVGISRERSALLAAQTLLGAAKMVLETGKHPAALKDEVTTPAGCTVDGLMALEEGKLRITLVKAVVAAAKRSRAMEK